MASLADPWYGGVMLSDARIKAAKPREKPYKLADSGQLFLHVTRAGGRHWRMNYAFGKNDKGKPAQKTLSFGSYPAITLLDARRKRDEAKVLLSKGLDPALMPSDAYDAFQALVRLISASLSRLVSRVADHQVPL